MLMLYVNLAIRTKDLYPTIDLTVSTINAQSHKFFFCLFVLFVCLALTLSLWYLSLPTKDSTWTLAVKVLNPTHQTTRELAPPSYTLYQPQKNDSVQSAFFHCLLKQKGKLNSDFKMIATVLKSNTEWLSIYNCFNYVDSSILRVSLVAQTVKNLLAIPRLNPWVGKIPWRREWLHTSVFLPGEIHGQRDLVG